MRNVFQSMLSVAIALVALGLNSGCGRQYAEGLKANPKQVADEKPVAIEWESFKSPSLLRAKNWNGTLLAKFRYRGKQPTAVRMWADNVECCRKEKDPAVVKLTYPFHVDEKGGLAEVVVFLKAEGTRNWLPTPEAKKKRTDEVVFTTPGCVLYPRVALHFPAFRNGKGIREPSGQKLILHETGDILHFLQLQQLGQPAEAIPLSWFRAEAKTREFERPISIACSIHSWMRAYVIAFDHPFAAISDEQGRLRLDGLPTDVPIHVAAWHPHFGYLWEEGSSGRIMTFRSGSNELEFVVEGRQ